MPGTGIITKDFAAVIDHDRKFNKTCAHPEHSHEWVGVYQCSPYLHRYTDQMRNARRKCNRQVTSEVRQKVFAAFAFSKRKGDCTFDQTAQADLVHILKTGRVKSDSKAEWFWQGKRLIGSCTIRPLPSNLQEATTAVPLHPQLQRLVDKRDRCTGQYQGANAFYSNQESESRTGAKVVDLSQTSCHGKSHADAVNNVPTGHLRQAAKDGTPVGAGARGLVLFLANKMASPASGKSTAWMSFDQYLVAFYPEVAFQPELYTAKKGYYGSSLDHFYTNTGLHRLGARHLRCFCTPCITNMRLYSDHCTLKDWCGRMRHYNLQPATTAVRIHAIERREIMTIEEFAKTLDTRGTPCGRVVVCIVHEDDVNPFDEPFYLARVVSKARQISQDCLVAGNEYPQGHLVVNIKWYTYVDTTRGDRLYRLQPGGARGVPYSVGSIIRNVDGIAFKSYNQGIYTFGRETVNRLNIILNE